MIAENRARDATACVQHHPDEQGWLQISRIPGATGSPFIRHIPPLAGNLHSRMEKRNSECGENFSAVASTTKAVCRVIKNLSGKRKLNLCRADRIFLTGRSIYAKTSDENLALNFNKNGVVSTRCNASLLHIAKRFCVSRLLGADFNYNNVPLSFQRVGLPVPLNPR